MHTNTKVWAFARPGHCKHDQELIYEEAKKGNSRFGWSSNKDTNLKSKDPWIISSSWRLLHIKKGDWIVHVNVPSHGKCIAGQVVEEYDFDEGRWGEQAGCNDFRHVFRIGNIIEFDRNNPNVCVRIRPMRRLENIHDVNGFLKSIENLKEKRITPETLKGDTKEVFHLKESTQEYLKKITKLLHKTHQSKKLERFMAEVFRRIEGVEHVKENGSGWGTDYGADLIVSIKSPVSFLSVENVDVVIQIKSYEGNHSETNAVEQIKKGIEKFGAISGMLITTAAPTEGLISEIEKVSQKINRPIELIAGEDVAKFILKHAPDLIFDLDVS